MASRQAVLATSDLSGNHQGEANCNEPVRRGRDDSPSVGHRQLDVRRSAGRRGLTVRQARQTRPIARAFFVAASTTAAWPRRRLVPGGKLSRLRQERLDERRRRAGAERSGGAAAAATTVMTKRSVSEGRGGAEHVFDEQCSDRGPSGAEGAQGKGSGPEAPADQGADPVAVAPLRVKELT